VASLLKAGIPAVVAMQFTVKDRLAAAFSAMFYQCLVAGCTVDEGCGAGSKCMRAEALTLQPDMRDWGVPVLYLRAQGPGYSPLCVMNRRANKRKKWWALRQAAGGDHQYRGRS